MAEFPTAVVLSITSGRFFCEPDDLYPITSWFIGREAEAYDVMANREAIAALLHQVYDGLPTPEAPFNGSLSDVPLVCDVPDKFRGLLCHK
jgi:hypothetical protein